MDTAKKKIQQKRSMKEKFMFLLTGKYPEKKEDLIHNHNAKTANTDTTTTSNIFSENSTENTSSEDLFLKATKMTLEQAEKKVSQWYQNNEMEKVKQGTALILEYFPDHYLKTHPPKKQETKPLMNTEEKTQPFSSKKKITTTKKESVLSKISKNPWSEIEIEAEELEKKGLPQENDINDDERVFAGISYFPLLSFFVLTTRKDSPFALYHAWQGFSIFAIFLASTPFYFLLGFIPGIGFLFWLFYIILFGISGIGAFMAWSGRYINIPIVSGFAQKLSGK